MTYYPSPDTVGDHWEHFTPDEKWLMAGALRITDPRISYATLPFVKLVRVGYKLGWPNNELGNKILSLLTPVTGTVSNDTYTVKELTNVSEPNWLLGYPHKG